VNLWTIGFTKKSAEYFFETLREAGVRKLVDVRLNNVSQLAGFAKRDDLSYFLRTLGQMGYEHMPLLAPTAEMLSAYRKKEINWEEYERLFVDLMRERQIESEIAYETLADSVLLCSEDQPDMCHRRLVAEYLAGHWGGIEIRHLT
jgi:uncharacterized protein (DUF488 family)